MEAAPGSERASAQGSAENGAIADHEKLRYYRDELKHEFALLTMRVNILVTCQSFLVVPFAILNTAARFRDVYIAVCLVASLGIFVALVLLAPIRATHRTIDKWLQKQRELFKRSQGLGDLAIDRDRIPGADRDPRLDRDHRRSLAFSSYAPWAFCTFWCAAVVFSTARAFG